MLRHQHSMLLPKLMDQIMFYYVFTKDLSSSLLQFSYFLQIQHHIFGNGMVNLALHCTQPNCTYKKHFAKICKIKSCRDALPPKKTLPQKPMKQVTMHTAMHAQTIPTHHSAMHLPRSYHIYIFPNTPSTIMYT